MTLPFPGFSNEYNLFTKNQIFIKFKSYYIQVE